MKVLMLTICVMACLLFIAGCGEEFAAGFGTGAVAIKKMSDDAQERFIVAVNELNSETERLNNEIGAVKDIDIETFIKSETVDDFESLKGRKDDPMTWIALASVLGGAFFGGQSYAKRKKVENG